MAYVDDPAMEDDLSKFGRVIAESLRALADRFERGEVHATTAKAHVSYAIPVDLVAFLDGSNREMVTDTRELTVTLGRTNITVT